jgi:hypothetical protein
MAVDNKDFAYVKQGQVLPAAGGASATSSFAYVKQGQPFPVIQAVANLQTTEIRLVTAVRIPPRKTRAPAWMPRGVKDTPAAPATRALPVVSVEMGSRRRRPNGSAVITRGQARISPSDLIVRPARISWSRVGFGRRAIRQPVILAGAARIGVADPRTRPALIAGVQNAGRRRASIRIQPDFNRANGVHECVYGEGTYGGCTYTAESKALPVVVTISTDMHRRLTQRRQPILSKPIKDTPAAPLGRTASTQITTAPRKKRQNGRAWLTSGAARISSTDPRTRPSLSVRGPMLVGRTLRRQPILTRGAAKISASDPRTQSATIVRAQTVRRVIRQPWLGRHAKDTPVVAQGRSRSLIVTGVRRPQRAVRQPWLAKHVKDTPVVITGRTRAVTVIAGPLRRRAVTQPFVGEPIHSDARLARALTILPASRPIPPRIQPWMPAAARTVATSAYEAGLVQQAPNRARRRGQAILSGRITFEDRIVPSTRIVSAAITRHRAQLRQPRVGVVWSKVAGGLPDLHATFGLQPALSATFASTAQLTASLGLAHGLCASFVLAPALSAAFDLRRAVRSTLVLEGWHEEP